MIRFASEEDVPFIRELLLPYINQQILLNRSEEEIKTDLPWTYVAEQGSKLVGVMNFSFFNPDLAEIRGLAVHPEYSRKGIGKQIVDFAMADLRKRKPEIKKVFALTYTPAFFQKLGFEIVPKEKYPAKIYEVCRFCLRQENCQEVAVEKLLS